MTAAAISNRLTDRERQLLKMALRIASEDGSIYGNATTDKAIARVTAEIEVLERKVMDL